MAKLNRKNRVRKVSCDLLREVEYSWQEAKSRGWRGPAKALSAVLEAISLDEDENGQPVTDDRVAFHVMSCVRYYRESAVADAQLGRLEAAKQETWLASFLEGLLPRWGYIVPRP